MPNVCSGKSIERTRTMKAVSEARKRLLGPDDAAEAPDDESRAVDPKSRARRRSLRRIAAAEVVR